MKLFFKIISLVLFLLPALNLKSMEPPLKKIKFGKEEKKHANFKPIFLPTALRITQVSFEIASLSSDKKKKFKNLEPDKFIIIDENKNNFSIDVQQPLLNALLNNARQRDLPEIIAITVTEDNDYNYYLIYNASALNKKLYHYEWDPSVIKYLAKPPQELRDPVYKTLLTGPTHYFLVDPHNNFIYIGNSNTIGNKSTTLYGNFLNDILSIDLGEKEQSIEQILAQSNEVEALAIHTKLIRMAEEIANIFYLGFYNIEPNLLVAKQYFAYAYKLSYVINDKNQREYPKKLAYINHELQNYKSAADYLLIYFDLILNNENNKELEASEIANRKLEDLYQIFQDTSKNKIQIKKDIQNKLKEMYPGMPFERKSYLQPKFGKEEE